MKKTFIYLIGAFMMTACTDFNDTTTPVTATVTVERPAAFRSTVDMSGITVTLQSSTDQIIAKTDANGKAVFTGIAPNTYNISVAEEISHARYEELTGETFEGSSDYMLTGNVNQLALATDQSHSLATTTFPMQPLVIGKLYFSGSKNSISNKGYDIGKYIELYNRSSETVDAAGLYIGIMESESTIAYQVYPNESAQTPGILHAKQVFRIPNSSPVLVQPGGTLLIVNSATDHTETEGNDAEEDLRAADFEAKDERHTVPNNDAVPALELIFTTYEGSITNMSLTQGGLSSVVIFRTDEDVTAWNKVRAYGKTTGRFFMEIPTHCVLDGVDLIKNNTTTGPNINTKRLFDDIDAGYTFEEAASGRNGERLYRKTRSVLANGVKVLQDTNNSLNDFSRSKTIRVGEYDEPAN